MDYLEEEKHGDSLDNLPPGYRFEPNPQELIQHYLTPKITGIALPVNPIHEINNIYHHSPEDVTARFNAQGEKGKNKVWYFMTSRDKKYMNGKRPNRKAGNGYWKATGKEKEVMDDNNQLIGHQRSLVYHIGVPQENMHHKTQWQMLELRVPDPPKPLLHNKRKRADHQQQPTMRLEGYVICRIYYKEKEGAANEGTETTEEATTSRSSRRHHHQQEQQIFTHNEQPLPLVVNTTTTPHNYQMISSQLFNNTNTNTNCSGGAYIPYISNNINRSGAYYIPETNNTNTNTNRSGANMTSNNNYKAGFGGEYSELSNNDNDLMKVALKRNKYDDDDNDDFIKMIDFDEVDADTQTLMAPPELDYSKMELPNMEDIPELEDYKMDFSHLVFPISTHIQ